MRYDKLDMHVTSENHAKKYKHLSNL